MTLPPRPAADLIQIATWSEIPEGVPVGATVKGLELVVVRRELAREASTTGPAAPPLRLWIPLIVSDVSFGAISEEATLALRRGRTWRTPASALM